MERLSPLDARFLNHDTPTEPRLVASLAIFEPHDPVLTYDRLIQVISERIDIVPRYRQVPRRVPGALGTPVWVDDETFDISIHVRRSALPKPGTRQSLHELVGRLVARRIDLDRPLWELYLVEGLENGAVALLFKAHQALVDGSETIDLAQVLLEESAHEREIPHEEWVPRPEPHGLELVAATLDRNARRPGETWRITEHQIGRLVRRLPIIGGSTPPPRGVLSAELSRHRRFASLATDLDDYRRVREEHGGTVNDVILASVAGGIRGWMLTRAEQVSAKTSFRAMVPMSVVSDDGLPTSLGSKVRGHLLSLPVGESNPVVRLHQVSYALKDHRETGSAVAANKLADLPGFATSTFHAVGARVADAETGRGHQIVITNVPGPQDPVYMAGEPVAEVYPCIPLSGSRAVSIGVTSYRGKVFFGLVADRDAVPDADVLAQCISEALVELVETVGRRTRAPRGRQRPPR
ncbi:wax ester/triacylglycerol synthase family O-acyltransferase [Aeromicrobium sp.]|uniref:wax ester/triacylglycerol synthase family O-acyltransferase n=1 Tax=Aeromicrobium sp. TaxID=1871063 RepID=UPI003D6C44C6